MEVLLETDFIPVGKAEMLIRQPADKVFDAFVNPAITTKFWFTKSSGRLDEQKSVRWDWEMYSVFANVTVLALEPNKRILVEWGGENEQPTTVEWVFKSLADDTTFVTITNSGFYGDLTSQIKQALDSTEGFTLVLAGLKAWLEHGIQLNLTADRFPAGM